MSGKKRTSSCTYSTVIKKVLRNYEYPPNKGLKVVKDILEHICSFYLMGVVKSPILDRALGNQYWLEQ